MSTLVFEQYEKEQQQLHKRVNHFFSNVHAFNFWTPTKTKNLELPTVSVSEIKEEWAELQKSMLTGTTSASILWQNLLSRVSRVHYHATNTNTPHLLLSLRAFNKQQETTNVDDVLAWLDAEIAQGELAKVWL